MSDFPYVDLPESVRAAIADSFGTRSTAEIALMLPAAEHLPLHPPYERVLLAIVGLADGDKAEVARYSRAALQDWRDVLYWWETPELADAASQRSHELMPIEEERDE